MKNSKFFLPAHGLNILEKTIVAFNGVNQPISAKEIEDKYFGHLKGARISACCTRLAEMGILEPELNDTYIITKLGKKLANKNLTDTQLARHWRDAVENNANYKKIANYITTMGRITTAEFVKVIVNRANRDITKKGSKDGAKVVIDILEKAKIIEVTKQTSKHNSVVSAIDYSYEYPADLRPFLEKFRMDYQDPLKCAFVMMKFEKSPMHEAIFKAVESICSKFGITALRADKDKYAKEVLPNVRTYLHGCGFGIAIFERIRDEKFNPNVTYEVGYLRALDKDVLVLMDETITSVPTDLAATIHEKFDTQHPKETIAPILEKFLLKNSYIE